MNEEIHIYVDININELEGWLAEGRYTEEDGIGLSSFSISENFYLCNEDYKITVVIDDINYISGKLSSIAMRFAASCLGNEIVGQVLWVNSDVQIQPGP